LLLQRPDCGGLLKGECPGSVEEEDKEGGEVVGMDDEHESSAAGASPAAREEQVGVTCGGGVTFYLGLANCTGAYS
jgi:hypothetical protein